MARSALDLLLVQSLSCFAEPPHQIYSHCCDIIARAINRFTKRRALAVVQRFTLSAIRRRVDLKRKRSNAATTVQSAWRRWVVVRRVRQRVAASAATEVGANHARKIAIESLECVLYVLRGRRSREKLLLIWHCPLTSLVYFIPVLSKNKYYFTETASRRGTAGTSQGILDGA